MIESIVFQGKKKFTAEYYATEIKNRSARAYQDCGYYIGYGNELSHTIVSDRTIRLNSGLFLVKGRQVAIVLGTSEEIQIPAQGSAIKGYIIARINTTVEINGGNVEITYKLGTTTTYPTLTQQDTYNTSSATNAVYELPLYSFSVSSVISNVVKLIQPITNTSVYISSTANELPSDYLNIGDLYIKLNTDGSRELHIKTGKGSSNKIGDVFSGTQKTKLANIEEYAQKNKIDTVKVNGSPLAIDADKSVNINMPTGKWECLYDNPSGLQVETATVHIDIPEGYDLYAIEWNGYLNIPTHKITILKPAEGYSGYATIGDISFVDNAGSDIMTLKACRITFGTMVNEMEFNNCKSVQFSGQTSVVFASYLYIFKVYGIRL